MPISPVTATSTGRVNLRDQTIVRFVMLTQRRCVWVVETPELACGRIVGPRRHDEFFEKGFSQETSYLHARRRFEKSMALLLHNLIPVTILPKA
jgi:hypothetical protein